MENPVSQAMYDLIKFGIVEDSGERRPDDSGLMQVVWKLSPLGMLVGEYQERLGLTLEQALAKVNSLGERCS